MILGLNHSLIPKFKSEAKTVKRQFLNYRCRCAVCGNPAKINVILYECSFHGMGFELSFAVVKMIAMYTSQ